MTSRRSIVVRTLPIAALAALLRIPAVRAQNRGEFVGEIVASFLPDGRNMRLEKPFGYVDPRGRAWEVPTGAVTDGASIPRMLWVKYPPFTGKYRKAAVVHDYFCQSRSRSWQSTHEVFYDAMLAAGVEDRTAKLMYGAVYRFGPRWDGRSPALPPPAAQVTATESRSAKRGALPRASKPAGGLASPAEEAKFLRDLQAWIDSDKPSIDQIARQLEDDGPPS